jgi:hypothetical protein
VVICHRTGSEPNPYVVINIPWTAWTEAHDPASSHAHPPLNGRVDIMLEDPASAPGAKDGFTADDCVTTGGPTGAPPSGTTGAPPSGTTGSPPQSTGGVSGATTGGTGGVSGATTGGTTGGVAATPSGGNLPFTGLPVWMPLLAGLGLLAGGYMLVRWKTRTSS